MGVLLSKIPLRARISPGVCDLDPDMAHGLGDQVTKLFADKGRGGEKRAKINGSLGIFLLRI